MKYVQRTFLKKKWRKGTPNRPVRSTVLSMIKCGYLLVVQLIMPRNHACIATIFELIFDKASNQTGPVPVFLDTLICSGFFEQKRAGSLSFS
jgi:hypothetical protein